MSTIQRNIYVVGPQARGESFLGRSREISDVESIFFSVSAIHLVGPTRIGKSSLVSKVFEKNAKCPQKICVQMSMGECQDAFDFWSTLSYKIQEQLMGKNLWAERFERYYQQLEKCTPQNHNWFMRFKLPLQGILKQIKVEEYSLVLSIDEFDSVVRVFGNNPYFFMVLRSIYSDPEYATSGIIISRKRLHLLEAECKDLSTYHGVFREKTLLAFNDEDMECFYRSLEELYGINLSSGGKKKLENYTGRIPYLCSMFAERLVANTLNQGLNELSIGDKEVNSIFRECLPQIEVYYNDLIVRLEYDHHLETICYLSLTSKFPSYITSRDIENLTTMGVLIPEKKNDIIKYYAYSKDFMTSFKLRPLKLPAWETMTQSERKIKAIFKKEFPKLDDVSYDDLVSDKGNAIVQRLNSDFPELNLNFGKIRRYCEDLSVHKDQPTILDVLTLSEVVKVILDAWETRFHKYFLGDESWKTKLEFIKDLRNPMAHAAIEYISSDNLSVCMRYCDEIIHLNC